MPSFSVKNKYVSDTEKFTIVLALKSDGVKYKAAFSDRTFRSETVEGLKEFKDLELGIEKPGSFMIDHELRTKVRGQNSASIKRRTCGIIIDSAFPHVFLKVELGRVLTM